VQISVNYCNDVNKSCILYVYIMCLQLDSFSLQFYVLLYCDRCMQCNNCETKEEIEISETWLISHH